MNKNKPFIDTSIPNDVDPITLKKVFNCFGEVIAEGRCRSISEIIEKNRKIPFHKSLIREANFANINLKGIDLISSWISDCTFYKVSFEGSELSGCEIENCLFHECDFKGSKATHLKMKKCTVVDSDFSGCDMRWSDFFLSKLLKVSFNKSDLLEAKLTHTYFSGSSFREANLDSANLIGSKAYYTDFEGSSLKKAKYFGLRYPHRANKRKERPCNQQDQSPLQAPEGSS